MTVTDRIEINPAVMLGKPVIRVKGWLERPQVLPLHVLDLALAGGA